MRTKEFLEFLEDEKVQQKIKEIVSSEDTTKTNGFNQREEELMGIIEEWKHQHQQLKERLNSQENQNQELEDKITIKNAQNKEIQNKLSFYKQNFEEELKIYEKFMSLQSSTKDSLSNIFKGNSLSDFISCGVQEKNIHNLWEYTKNEILENKNQEISKLIEIFYFLFERCQVSFDIYQLLDTNIDENFNTQEHLKHNESTSSSGNISKVYLQGYKNIKTDKIIKQSVVKIG